MTLTTWKRLAPGLYEAEGDAIDRPVIDRDDDGHWGTKGQWWIRTSGFARGGDLWGPFRTLRDAKAAFRIAIDERDDST